MTERPATQIGAPYGVTFPAEARAVWFVGPRQVEIRSELVAAPGPGEVTIRTIKSLISQGTELKYYRGDIPAGVDVGLPTMKGDAFPMKFGYACVGEVVGVGSGAPYQTGDLVFSRHPHQSLFTIAVEHDQRPQVVKIPDDVDPDAALFLNLTEVALNALLDAPVDIGDVVVIYGQGVVGLLLSQLARLAAGRVIAVDPIASRRSMALSLGVDAAVTPDDAEETVRRLTDGRLADLVIEASGSPATLQQAIRVATSEGTILLVSYYGSRKVELTLTPWFDIGRMRLVSTMVRALSPRVRGRWDMRRRTRTALELLHRLDVRTFISHRVPIDEASRAYGLLEEDPENALAVVLTY